MYLVYSLNPSSLPTLLKRWGTICANFSVGLHGQHRLHNFIIHDTIYQLVISLIYILIICFFYLHLVSCQNSSDMSPFSFFVSRILSISKDTFDYWLYLFLNLSNCIVEGLLFSCSFHVSIQMHTLLCPTLYALNTVSSMCNFLCMLITNLIEHLVASSIIESNKDVPFIRSYCPQHYI